MLILASASPRRRELLDQIGVCHEVRPVDVDETPHPGEAPDEFARRMARSKALAGAHHAAGRPVLGADTVVSIDGDILGKPMDREHALDMLGRLSGRDHTVYSAVALVQGERIRDALSATRVRFKCLSLREREDYWASGEPVDKAGAYGIQGLAALFVEHIEGSYSGVVGLPLFETGALLAGD
ncbi:septum formation protein Maf [Ectothiorhodospira haloalkaliphila]|uniref:dTTP/UTP pyrophosphatase n=1 Tax=Ectothiorhodospira haloalkaliphila TaxID=421628 RepID=W8KIV7_9GAMM|nr:MULTISPECIES: Maf family protein [Ectothiorhodospira]AHK79694.1 septum formation protein Maf [Ectothiorhodospira haloalkaliphila]MCG5495725.1 Maf family nucleotide pyrophosphatase [Ectothiorhodospira variabilis]MCG5498661.1 Maf family nucleotide pyrophosphatase [Ectothiorhodospira variabilis]MCG5503259.1 Maf family nucleotide pyrophosphatase [Ectothiorhodospira variabilis]MCG5505982.1 Maf family nucleotide pyrophosphatase [Ectothiorhodospira variabilis]